ncbi:DUF2334 domain-containing protein [Schleiferiaceae bacterium]|nr:DUF2334 domain-containing protein [Schleiferiaceae bacterium]
MLILRLDDITEQMNWERFEEIEILCSKHNIRPILGVIPLNRDESFTGQQSRSSSYLFTKLKNLQKAGWCIAQHGTYHLYHNNYDDVLRINNKSEFSGLPYNDQLELIRLGKHHLESMGLNINMFMAPSHSFDRNTVLALNELGFKYMTDGYHWQKYQFGGICFIPQLFASFFYMSNFGIWTVCLHINTYSDKDWENIKRKIIENKDKFIMLPNLESSPMKISRHPEGSRVLKIVIKTIRNVKYKLINFKIS